MLTAQQKELLNQAILKLEEADALVQAALGPTDVCYETHNRIEDIAEDLRCDVEGILE
jgi:hypothetical protein